MFYHFLVPRFAGGAHTEGPFDGFGRQVVAGDGAALGLLQSGLGGEEALLGARSLGTLLVSRATRLPACLASFWELGTLALAPQPSPVCTLAGDR